MRRNFPSVSRPVSLHSEVCRATVEAPFSLVNPTTGVLAGAVSLGANRNNVRHDLWVI